MWPNVTVNNQSPDPFQPIRDGLKEIHDDLAALPKMGATLDAILKQIQTSDYAETREDVTVYTGQALTFRANGYRYNRLVVGDAAASDAAKVVVSLGGVSWTVTLTAGVNSLDMPDGATYQGQSTSGNNFIGVLIRSNKE